MTYSPIEWATNGILYFMCFALMNTTLTYRYNKWFTFTCQLVLFFFYMYTTDLCAFMSLLRMMQGPIHFGVIAMIFYTDKWPRKLFTAFMPFVAIITSELERGVGKRILKELAEKYDGSLNQEEKDGLFHAKLILRLGADSQ